MNFRFNEDLAKNYKSEAQKIRVMSEAWVAENVFCPCCGNPRIERMGNNKPVFDFRCDCCGGTFELKSKKGNIKNKITDGAYDTMIRRITSSENPDLLVLQYSPAYDVENLIIVPKYFFVPSIIEKRKPLSDKAGRGGWVGCNILLSQIPHQGKIEVITNQYMHKSEDVVERYRAVRSLQIKHIEKRGWLMDVLNCVNDLATAQFTLENVYSYIEALKIKHPLNNNIEAKIRQQLQILRDSGLIKFMGKGVYQKIVF